MISLLYISVITGGCRGQINTEAKSFALYLDHIFETHRVDLAFKSSFLEAQFPSQQPPSQNGPILFTQPTWC